MWTEATRKKYDEKVKCYIDEYDKFTIINSINLKVNGSQTKTENVADNGGIAASFLAWKAWKKDNPTKITLPGIKYTEEQLFFLSWGRTWYVRKTAF